jgi:hypothetical protein
LAPQADARQPARWSAQERAQIYQRVLGAPGGVSGEGKPNREFEDLWLRFVSSVAQFGRQARQALHAPALSGESVRTAARDLAGKVSPLVDSAWAARDRWQAIDRVNDLELGGAANSARHRTMAESGGAILEWLVEQDDGAGTAGGLDDGLLQAAEQWLAAAGARDGDVQALSQPEAAQIYRIDVSQVVSKYIGETEKNLDVAFRRTEPSSAVLLFDEADALLGKRSDVHDSHDRYADQEVSHLLQRVESYQGVTILTTNAKEEIDPDVLKRLRAVVAFPIPPR